MKRLIPIILLVSLLCACAPNTPAEQPAPTPEASAAPDDGAFGVYMDFSKYVPYKAPENVYTRLSEEWIPDLAAGDDYGMLYPFVGSKLYSSGSDGYSYELGSLYGLFDANGRIVADPTYAEIEPLSYYDYAKAKSCRTPFLLLTRGVSTGTVDYGYGEYVEGSAVYSLASLDGSFVTECKYGMVRGFAEGVLCAESYDAKEFVLYDYYGNILMTEEDIPFDDYYVSSISYDDGIISMSSSTNYSEYYYLDLSGNILHGPYSSCEPYRNGAAVVTPMGYDYGVNIIIDRQGNPLSDKRYDYLSSVGDGLYIEYVEDGPCRVVTAKGDVVFEYDCDTLSKTEYGYSGWTYDAMSNKCFFFDKQGNVLLSSTPEEWTEVYGTPLAEHRSENGTELVNILTGKTYFSEGESYVWPLYTDMIVGEPAKTLDYIFLRHFDSMNSKLLDYNFNIVYESCDVTPEVVLDPITGNEYLQLGSDGLYDKDFNSIGTFAGRVSVYNDRIMYANDVCFTCTDMDGNVIFRYCYTMSGGD